MKKRKFSHNQLDEVFDFIVENGIATEEEIKLVTAINGYNEETLNDIIEVRTGYHSVEQLHDCEPDSYSFYMIEGLEEEKEDFSKKENRLKELTRKDKEKLWHKQGEFYMLPETGAVGSYEDWWYDELDEEQHKTGNTVNAVDLGEVWEVFKDKNGEYHGVWDDDEVLVKDVDFSCGDKGQKKFANDSINKEELIASAKTAAKYNDAEEEFKHFKKAVENSKATSLYDLYIELKDVSDKMVEKNYNLYDFQDLGFMPKDLTDAAWKALGIEFLFETGNAENEKDALTKINKMAPSPEFERWCKRNHIVLH